MNLADAVAAQKATKIGPRTCASNRCSSMGQECDRRLVYERTRWQDKKMHDVELQNIFDLGIYLEDHYLQELKAAGFTIIQQQRSLSIPDAEITGSIDAAIQDVPSGDLYPIDVKTMSPHVWTKLESVNDFFDHKYAHVRGYPTQVLLYAHMMNSKWACIYAVNKLTGKPKDFWFKVADYGDVVAIAIERAKAINVHIRANTLPDRIEDLTACAKCPFAHVCLPDKQFSEESLLTDEDLLVKLERWHATRDVAKEHDELDEEVKGRLKSIKGLKTAKIGDFAITIQDRERKEWWVDENTRKLIGELKKNPYKVAVIRKFLDTSEDV